MRRSSARPIPMMQTPSRRQPRVDVVLAVLRGYGLESDDAIHTTRIIRASLHGFVSLEASKGFAWHTLAPRSTTSFRATVAARRCALWLDQPRTEKST
jgi:hypothetical protein